MQTEAIFENIAERIQQEISRAQKSVFVAVAWFTNKNLFRELLYKARNGCSVSLIISNDPINLGSGIDFTELVSGNSKVYKIGDGESELMHNKFCIIDFSTVITGSYNWSYKAETNFENVIITYNDTVLAEQFVTEFDKIRKRYFPEVQEEKILFPLNKIIKRLEILMNYIQLEDIEELDKEILKLKEYQFNSDLDEIIEDIEWKEFAAAVAKIQKFVSRNQQLLVWTDPEIAALKLEIKNLENQLNGFDNEKTELEKLLLEFQHRHTLELGEIILEILKLRKLKFKANQAKYEEAENDEKQYREQVNVERQRKVFELTTEQKVELKKKFRKATLMCHPDKVSDEFKEAAQRIFIDLKQAYDANDLSRVTEILDNLERGNYLKPLSETLSEKELLKSSIAKLRAQIKTLETEIIAIRQSETYKTVASIDNWDVYFEGIKEKLQRELEELMSELIQPSV